MAAERIPQVNLRGERIVVPEDGDGQIVDEFGLDEIRGLIDRHQHTVLVRVISVRVEFIQRTCDPESRHDAERVHPRIAGGHYAVEVELRES